MHIVRGVFSGIFAFVLVCVLVILGIVVTVDATILNPEFLISEFDRLDIYSIVVDQAKSQLVEAEPHMAQIADESLAEVEPWLREQAASAVYSGCAYLKGEKELDIVISLEQPRAILKENLAQTIHESPPPELERASQAQIEAFIAQACAEIDSQVPEQVEINELSVGPEAAAHLREARQIVGYIELGRKALIGLAVVLILVIALIQWWYARAIARYVGIAFAVAGGIGIAGSILARSLIPGLIQLEVPPAIEAKLPQLVGDSSGPLQIYGIAFLVVGIVLIVLSIKLKSRSAENW
ncbi:MAG: hypothetical protein U9Q17_02110 [Chloroflexota bacterium]|nr:hypothetical protein [Chloroflexota bacterium]